MEITEVEASADLVGNDEPERAAYETRLHSLHDAVGAVEKNDLDITVSGVAVTVEVTAVPVTSLLESSAELERPDGSGPSEGTTHGS